MSDFKTFLQEQLQDPEFRELWKARNGMIFQRPECNMALSEMEITEKEMDGILRLLEEPEMLDAKMEELICRHIVQ